MLDTVQCNEIITTVINALIIPLLPIISAYLVAFIRRKTAEIEAGLKNEEMKKYVTIAENAIVTAVTAVNQVYVDSLKKANGSLTPYEQKVAFEMAREKTLNILGESSINALKELFKDLDSWLEGRIEYYVNISKTDPQQLTRMKLI